MENEIMNNDEVIETVGEEVVETCKGSGIIVPVLVGTAIVGAGFGLYKLGRKAWDKYKSKKALTIEPKWTMNKKLVLNKINELLY